MTGRWERPSWTVPAWDSNPVEHMGDEEAKADAQQLREKARRKLALIAAAFLGATLAVIGVVVYYLLQPRDTTPKLTRDRFEAAKLKWEQAAPKNYNIEIKVTGLQAATYNVQVRRGDVVSASRNGTPLPRRHGFATWSVPGMFSTIGHDVEQVQAIQDGSAKPGASRLELRGEFDCKFGYPQHYYRYEWKTRNEVSWDVTEFEPIEDQVVDE